jgi:hypothetical protein
VIAKAADGTKLHAKSLQVLHIQENIAVSLRLALPALMLLPLLGGNAHAQPSEAVPPSGESEAVIDEAEALAMDAKLYAQEFGVSFDEALNRMTIMVYGSDVVAQEASLEGADLAGRFYENKTSDFGLTIATKKAAKAAKAAAFTPRTKANYGRMNAAAVQERNAARKALHQKAGLSDSEVRKAQAKLGGPVSVKVRYKTGQTHTLAELNAGKDAVIAMGAQITAISGASVDEIGNNVRVFLTKELSKEEARDLQAKAGVALAFDTLPGGFVATANMRGGSKLYRYATDTSASSRDCMTAFGARSNSLRTSTGAALTGMVSAAHCADTLHVIADDGRNVPLTVPAGHVADTRGGVNETDIQFMSGTNGDPVGLGTFYYDGTTNLRAVSGTQSRAGTAVGSGDVYTVTGTAVGSYICHLGQTSLGSTTNMQSCGEVISINASLSSNQPASSASYTGGSFVAVRNTSSGKGTVLGPSGTGTLRCYSGDSGGPWFAGTIAYGVQSWCAWENGVANSNRVLLVLYTSTDFFSRAGVSIIVP